MWTAIVQWQCLTLSDSMQLKLVFLCGFLELMLNNQQTLYKGYKSPGCLFWTVSTFNNTATVKDIKDKIKCPR